jgi:SAM-dependent methyltransferase
MNAIDDANNINDREIENCIICSSDCTRVVYWTKDMLYRIEGTYRIARCMRCKTEFITPYPSVEFLSSLYSVDNYYSFQQRKMGRLLREIRKRTRRLFPPPTSSITSICDVGCGDGEFLDFAQQAGFQTFGVEQDGQAQVLNSHTSHTILPSIHDHMRSFDYIRANHTLEHVHDIRDILLGMKMHLAPEGRILIGVPNAQGFIAKLFGRYWFYRGAPIHTMGLNEESFQILCCELDLEITEVVKRQTFRGTVGSIVIAMENLLLGSSREPKTLTFLLLMPVVLVTIPLNWLLTQINKGDLLEVSIKHKYD